MSLINALSDQTIVWFGLGGLVGSFFCFLIAAINQFLFQQKSRSDRMTCLKRALMFSGAGNLLLVFTAVFTSIAVYGAITRLSYICACGLFAFGLWLLHKGRQIKGA